MPFGLLVTPTYAQPPARTARGRVANAFRPSGHCDPGHRPEGDRDTHRRQCLSAFWSLRPRDAGRHHRLADRRQCLSAFWSLRLGANQAAAQTVCASPMPFGLLVTATHSTCTIGINHDKSPMPFGLLVTATPVQCALLPEPFKSPMPFGLLVTATSSCGCGWSRSCQVANAFRPSGHCDAPCPARRGG